MLCSYLGTLVLRKVFGKVKGVGLGNQPLSALMEEKLKSPVIKTGLISMKGDLKMSCGNADDTELTEPIDMFKNDDIGVIIGHPESWLTDTAQDIIDALRKDDLIIFSFLDESRESPAHQGQATRCIQNPQLKSSSLGSNPMLTRIYETSF